MVGVLVFRSLEEALRAGFEVFDKTPEGYLVRALQAGRWALAIVDLHMTGN